MLLVINIGNTNTRFGFFARGKLTVRQESTADFRRQKRLGPLLKQILGADEMPDGCAMSSAVPELTQPFADAVLRLTGKQAMLIGADMITGVDFSVYPAKQLGADRVAVCAAALHKYAAPLIVIDMGTAIAFNVIDQDGRFQGGAILPGMRTGIAALAGHTARLPELDLEAPARLIGRNTGECLLSGAYYGTACIIDGLSAQISEALGKKATVVITGGDSRRILPFCKTKILHDPDLLMEGLEILYRLNAP